MFNLLRRNSLTLIFLLIIIVGCAASMYILGTASKNVSMKPVLNKGKKWRLAYYEGALYHHYVLTLTGFVDALVEKGWIKKFDKTSIPEDVYKNHDSKLLWKWLNENTVSDFIEFPVENYWRAGWASSTRADSVVMIENGWKLKSFDLIISLGTRAGLDLVNINHKFPILLLSITDPKESTITKSDMYSGFPNVYTVFDPERIDRCIKVSHEILKFKSLGMIVGSHGTSELSSGVPILMRLSKEMNFKISKCVVDTILSDHQKITEDTVACVKKMIDAKEIDAFIFTKLVGVPLETIPLMLKELNAHKIPSIAIDSAWVEQGVFTSYGMVGTYNERIGALGAEATVKIFKGIKPGEIKNAYEEIQRGFVLNMTTANALGIKIPSSMLHSAFKVYH